MIDDLSLNVFEAWAPLVCGYRFDPPELISLAKKYGKDVPKILLRYSLQKVKLNIRHPRDPVYWNLKVSLRAMSHFLNQALVRLWARWGWNFQSRSVKPRLARPPIDNLKMIGLVIRTGSPTTAIEKRNPGISIHSARDSFLKPRNIFNYLTFGCCKLESSTEEVQPVIWLMNWGRQWKMHGSSNKPYFLPEHP